MGTYGELAAVIGSKIDNIMAKGEKPETLFFLIDSWSYLTIRDSETPEAIKIEKVKTMLGYIEKCIEEINVYDEKHPNTVLNLTIAYVDLCGVIAHSRNKEDEIAVPETKEVKRVEEKIITADCIMREIKLENGQGARLNLDLYSVSNEKKSRIEEAMNNFFNSVVKILNNETIC